MSASTTILEGRLAVAGAVDGGFRTVERIWYSKPRPPRNIARLLERAGKKGIPCERVPVEQLQDKAGGRSHGGLIGFAGARRILEPAELLPAEGAAFVVMLDGIEDPYNYAYALRSLYAAGVDGVVVRPRTWETAAATIARASAGASERMPMAEVETAEAAAALYRGHGLRVACTSEAGATPLYEADLTQPLFLLIGGERRGITRSFVEQADLLLRVPYGRSFEASLPGACATAVISFEVMRARTAS